MNALGWSSAMAWLALAGILVCAAIIAWDAYRTHRDRTNRRLRRGELYQHRTTKRLPDDWMDNFRDRK